MGSDAYYLDMGGPSFGSNILRPAILAALLFMGRAVAAQTDEIQVYTGELASPGEFNLTVHANFTPCGQATPAFLGGVTPKGSLNGAFEWAYGVRLPARLTDWC